MLKIMIIFICFLFFSGIVYSQTYINFALSKPVITSWKTDQAQLLTDGSILTGSMRSDTRGTIQWIDFDLTAEFQLGGIHLYFDTSGILPLQNFSFQYNKNNQWVNIPGTSVHNNLAATERIVFQKPVSTTAIRMLVGGVTNFGIKEVQIWGKDVPPLPYDIAVEEARSFKTDKHWVCVNQVAYNLNAPKRFTVPTAKTDLPFTLLEKESGKVVFSGTLKNGTGDFSLFNPKQSRSKEYFIHVEGDGLKPGDSFPFIIGKHALQKMAYQPAVDFFNDARSMVGTHPSAFGGTAWRDGTYYTFEVPSLVMLYLSNPRQFDKMPVTLSWQKEKELVFSPGYKPTREPNDEDALQTVKNYYTILPKPVSKRIPDIIQCIRFGIGWNLLDPVSADPSGDPSGKKIHSQTVEQFAFFLFGYPKYKQFISKDFYRMVLDSTLKWWDKSGLMNLDTIIGNPKGRNCPGHSIMPNLMMYEVAKRENLKNSKQFLNAARVQTEWLIRKTDWNNPIFTKGQRMSEHKLVTGLAYFQSNYQALAPSGLKKKLTEWAEKAVSLSDNMWDFRKLDNNTWTLPGYNEAGNVIGFPACALAVAMVLDKGPLRNRLIELAYSHYDNFCGRNPQNAHCANHPDLGFKGIERGWPFGDPRRNICARLELVRGSLSSLPGSEMYPFNPAGKPRHGEGWTAYNADWNLTLSYLNFFENNGTMNLMHK